MHYIRGKNRDQVFMTSLDQLVEPDSFARLVDVFVDALPILEMGFTHSKLNKEGNLPYHPSDLFKLLLYGYRHYLRSASKLAKACKINVEVMWLMKGLHPSKRTINYFRRNNKEAIEKAHRHFVKMLRNWKLIDGSVMAVDGTVIHGQNSLKNNFNAKKIKGHLSYIDSKIDFYLKELEAFDDEDPSYKQKLRIASFEERISDLEERRAYYEEIGEVLSQEKGSQVSLSDQEAKSIYRRRFGITVGYNIQATVDAKYNLVVDVFAGGVNDFNEFGKAAKRAQQISGVEKIDMLADKGYHNGVHLASAERRGVRPFVGIRKLPERRPEGFRKSDFKYDKSANEYICPAGERLVQLYEYKWTVHKNPYTLRRYGTKACKECRLKAQCTDSKSGRVISRPIHEPYIERNDRRVTKYKDFFRLRQQIIEHVFGKWKRNWGMTYTLLKGKGNVETEFRLAAICYNLRRSMSILGEKTLIERLKALFSRIIGQITTEKCCEVREGEKLKTNCITLRTSTMLHRAA